ncbi:hypothetical protein SAMN05216203_1532 [Marinobacter daqiaonensis]|uniref:Uncharacterized protein n=1 Tax=Marinobacter daqiaonensis TaxID=650891 RepID=A0A1I6HTM5_9GAMM|nr:hypothetical protein SAMN05216203_1532 [Marinobacter daqiaonensis]
MRVVKRMDLIVPAWLLILTGSGAFLYCAYAGLLTP